MAAGARGQPQRRAGAQTARRGADGRADAERGGVQPGRPHPALQQPRAHAVPRAVERAQRLRRRRADHPGPPIYTVFDRAPSPMRWRACSSAAARRRTPSAQFVTGTRAGQPLRVADGAGARDRRQPGEVSLNGFVLMLENITRDFADESERDTPLHGLTEGSPRQRWATCRRRKNCSTTRHRRRHARALPRRDPRRGACDERASRSSPATPRRP